MTDPVRIGVLGCGRIGRMHADLLATRVEGASPTAVFDVVADAAADVASRTGATACATPEELIGRDDVDAVAICSSTDTHIDLLEVRPAWGGDTFYVPVIDDVVVRIERAERRVVIELLDGLVP